MTHDYVKAIGLVARAITKVTLDPKDLPGALQDLMDGLHAAGLGPHVAKLAVALEGK